MSEVHSQKLHLELCTNLMKNHQFHLHERAPQLVVLRQLVTEEVVCVGRGGVSSSARLTACAEHHAVVP